MSLGASLIISHTFIEGAKERYLIQVGFLMYIYDIGVSTYCDNTSSSQDAVFDLQIVLFHISKTVSYSQ